MIIPLFTDLFQALSDQQKSDYLFHLLEDKPKRRLAFVKHFESLYEQVRLEKEDTFSLKKSIHLIIEESKKVSEILGELNFEETDWERWQGSTHYVPDYEVARIVAEDEASEVFEYYISQLGIVLQTSDLTDIISDFTAVFHGITCAEITDPECNLGDPANDYFFGLLDDIIQKNQKILQIRRFADSDFQHGIDLSFYFNSLKYSDKKEYLKFISEILISAVNNKTQAEQVWTSKKQFEVGLNSVPTLLNKVTKLLGDKKVWKESLESCFLQDYDTSIELMQHYHSNDNVKFEYEAVNLWNKFHERSLAYLLNNVKIGTPFHVTLLKKNAAQNGETKSLELLKQYISTEEIEKFIDSMENNNSKARFYAHEKCFDKLTDFINANCNRGQNTYFTIDFEIVVAYLFADRPKAAWEMIKNMIALYMKYYRSRNGYAYIAKLLVMACQIKGSDLDLKELTTNLYNHKPNLSALKDEFRKAGLL